jgi:hypothetical protein
MHGNKQKAQKISDFIGSILGGSSKKSIYEKDEENIEKKSTDKLREEIKSMQLKNASIKDKKYLVDLIVSSSIQYSAIMKAIGELMSSGFRNVAAEDLLRKKLKYGNDRLDLVAPIVSNFPQDLSKRYEYIVKIQRNLLDYYGGFLKLIDTAKANAKSQSQDKPENILEFYLKCMPDNFPHSKYVVSKMISPGGAPIMSPVPFPDGNPQWSDPKYLDWFISNQFEFYIELEHFEDVGKIPPKDLFSKYFEIQKLERDSGGEGRAFAPGIGFAQLSGLMLNSHESDIDLNNLVGASANEIWPCYSWK